MKTMEDKGKVLTAQIAAAYLGCKVEIPYCINPQADSEERDYSKKEMQPTGLDFDGYFDEKYEPIPYKDCQLILKPLNQISNEDAMAIAAIVGLTPDYCKIHRMQDAIFLNEDTYQFQISHNGYCCMRKNNVLYNLDIRKVYNFLRSKSYDIDNLIEQNIAITKLK